MYFSMVSPLAILVFSSRAELRLSKAYGLISRFSEDIDITVFREDIGQAASVPELEGLSRKKRQFKLEAIKNTCREYIQNTLARQFGEVVRELSPNRISTRPFPTSSLTLTIRMAKACCSGIHP